MRMLNLDTVRQPLGSFTLGGKVYQVWPLTVGQLINLAAMPDTEVGNLHTLLDILHESIPDCPMDVLRRLDLAQLNRLSQWIQGGVSEDAEKNSGPLPPGDTAADAPEAPHETLSLALP